MHSVLAQLNIATALYDLDDPRTIVNLSVWKSIKELKHFIYHTVHVEFLQRKTEWFHKSDKENHVLWWIDQSHTLTLDEAIDHLEKVRANGSTNEAFTLRSLMASTQR